MQTPLTFTFEHVTKLYGPVLGVNDVDCQVGPGITGLLGANGAGKTTLIKLASGQLRPSQGEVRLGPHRAWSTAAKRLLGYCPDVNSFYEEMTGREFVRAMASLCGYARAEVRRRTELALEEVGMTELAERPLAAASHGMRQRIKLAQALVHDPPILLLDEPLLGVNPGGRRAINELLLRMADRGKTILVSSHILTEIEHLAETILFMHGGRLVASGTLAEVRGQLRDQPALVAIACSEARRMAGRLVSWPEVQSVEVTDDGLLVHTVQPAQFFAAINQLVLEEEFDVRQLQTLDGGADAVFGYLERSTV